MTFKVRPAVWEDADWFADRLRDEDKQEAETATGAPVRVALQKAVKSSAQCLVAELAGEPCVIFGISKHPQKRSGIPWLLATTTVVKKAPLALLKAAPALLREWLAVYPVLENVVDLRNTQHIRWLKRLGCVFGVTHVINGYPFQHFQLTREDLKQHVRTRSSNRPDRDGGNPSSH